jgi:hypothetical protein
VRTLAQQFRNLLSPFFPCLTLGSLFPPFADTKPGLLLFPWLGRPLSNPIGGPVDDDPEHALSRARAADKAPGLQVDPGAVRQLCRALPGLAENRYPAAVLRVREEFARGAVNLNLPTARSGLVVALACLAILATGIVSAAPPAWVARSNEIARQVIEDGGRFNPEWPSSSGEERYDTAIADLGPKLFERQVAQIEKRLAMLRALRTSERDTKVRQDLDILIDSRERAIESLRLGRKHLIGVYSPADIVNFGLSSLLDQRNRSERQARALVRLKRYAGLEKGYVPIATLARQRTEEELSRPRLTGPYIEEVRRQLDNTPIFLKGMAELFAKAKLTGWEQDFAVLSGQLKDYDDWVRRAVLPRARTTPRLPPAIYANRLRQVGVDAGPDELIERASFDFQELRDQMQGLAQQVAASRKLPSADYRDVIRALKKQQVEPAGLLQMYRDRLKDIEAVIRREKLVSLPNREAIIRIATEAEAAGTAAPQMRTPRLIGNTGERGEFLIPIANPHAKSAAPMDDYSFDAAAWTLTAHEARPGHELQFASMVEQGVSLPRAIFAFNSANVEGWGLYAEALMLPFMPPDAQLVSLQWRLLRVARAFLDPMVNLGRLAPAEAKRFLMEEVVLSEPFSQQEIDRYAFDAPGQATAYYYGYLRLRALRTQAEIAMGKRFELMAFNDFIVAQGLLPPRILQQTVMEEFVPAQR